MIFFLKDMAVVLTTKRALEFPQIVCVQVLRIFTTGL